MESEGPSSGALGRLERPGVGFRASRQMAVFAAFVSGYPLLLAAFGSLDWYSTGFDRAGHGLLAYNILRVLFCVYFLAMLAGAGFWALRMWVKFERPSLGYAEAVLLCVFAGFGVWQIVLFALGLAGYLERSVILWLSVMALLASYPLFAICCDGLRTRSINASTRAAHPIDRIGLLCIKVTVIALVLALAITKGLFPAGGHDYYTHYFHYYREVVESGSIWPNDVWYHFYYSKGAGVFFLAMLLLDPLAPSLVTLSLLLGGALAIYVALRKSGAHSGLALASAAVFIAIYIYTPGPPANAAHGGWGDFEKLHEIGAAVTAFLLYGLAGLVSRESREGVKQRIRWGVMLAGTGALLVTPPLALFFVLTAGACGLVQAFKRDWVGAADLIWCACVFVMTTVGVMSLNYLATGIASDQGMLFFWKFADFQKLSDWGVLPEMIEAHGEIWRMASARPSVQGTEALQAIGHAFRLEYIWPLFALAATVTLISRVHGAAGKPLQPAPASALGAWSALLPVSIAAVVGLVISIFFGLVQPISFYRGSSFLLPVSIMLAGLLLAASFGKSRLQSTLGIAAVSSCVALGLTLWVAVMNFDLEKLRTVLKSSARFALGEQSIHSAYSMQAALPGRLPWGAIYPGALEAWKTVPPDARLWSLNVHAYCMAPGCKVRTARSYRLQADWLATMRGTANEARAALQAVDLNHFLISTDLSLSDPLAVTSLFHPDHISEHLAVAWTDGVTALLTWPGPHTQPISSAWLGAYRGRLRDTKALQPSEDVRLILERIALTGDPALLRSLDWADGPQAVHARPTVQK